MLDYFLPTSLQALTWAAVLGQTMVFYVLGRCLWQQTPALVSVVAGWGIAGITLLMWGTLTPLPLWGGWLIVLAGAVGGYLWQRPHLRPSRAETYAWLLLVPLFLLTASAQPAQWDEFSHWLWAGQYLAEFHQFQHADIPPSWAGLPAYPQFLPILFYAPSVLIGAFAETSAAVFNTFLLLGIAGMGAWVLRRRVTALSPWGAALGGVLLATLLNPVFVPKLIFVAYADMPLGVALVVAIWALMMGLTSHGWRPYIVAGFALAVVVGLKQVGLVIAVIVASLVAMLCVRSSHKGPWWHSALVLLPVLAAYGLWRWYVVHNMPVDEFSFRAWENWHWDHYQSILGAVWHVITNKGHYFVPMFLIALAGLAALWRPSPNRQLCWLAGGVFAGYNAFLLITYFGAFTLNEATHAASYWRYNTTFGWLIPLVLASTMLPWILSRLHPPKWLATTNKWAISAGLVALPLAVVDHLRFDNNQGKAALRGFADKTIALDQPACILPYAVDGGTQFAYLFLRYHLYPHTDLIQRGVAPCHIELNYPMQALKKQKELPIVMRVTLADKTEHQWTVAGDDWLEVCNKPGAVKNQSAKE